VVAMLTRPTLVLNRNWQPVGAASVARSLTLVAAERARIVDPTDFQQYTWADWARLIPAVEEPFVQSVTFRIRVPEVITLTEYDRVPTNAVRCVDVSQWSGSTQSTNKSNGFRSSWQG